MLFQWDKAVLKEVGLYPAMWRYFENCLGFQVGQTSGMEQPFRQEKNSSNKALISLYQLVICISCVDLFPKLQNQIYNFTAHQDVMQAPQTHLSVDGDTNYLLLPFSNRNSQV